MARAITRKRRVPAQHRDNRPLLVGGAIAAFALVAILVFINLNVTTQPVAANVSATRVWGQANAPVTIEIFSDLQCPVCARGDKLLNQLASQYIDTGKAKVIYRHFAFIGVESQWAAQAAECAGEQNKFWAYANFLFSHQAGENAGAFGRANLKRFAREVGLDPGSFNACFDSGKYAAKVNQDTDEGRQRGVKATPTFFINDERFEGLLSQNAFATLIEAGQKR